MNEQPPEKLEPQGAMVKCSGSVEVLTSDGHVSLSQRELRDLAGVGALVRDTGAANIYRAGVLMLQQRLNAVMDVVMAELKDQVAKTRKARRDITGIAQLANAQAHLAAQVIDSQRILHEIERLSSHGDMVPLVRSFAPGQIVVPRREPSAGGGA